MTGQGIPGHNPANIVWTWVPETKKYDEKDPHRFDDIAEEYAVEIKEKADAGLILWGKYRGKWQANPSGRAVIAKILAERGIKIEPPKARDDW